MTERSPHQNVLDHAWDQVVGGIDWLKAVVFGEFADNRPLSALVTDMLASFLPGVVIVTSARDAVAVILRLAAHPEKREELMEWVLLSSCLIVLALPLVMAAGGAAAAGVGAIVGGLAGSELGAALRAVMLMLIKEAQKLVELVQFLQKFLKGDVLKFLRSVKFAQYEKALLHTIDKFTGQLLQMVKALRGHLESLRYFDGVKESIVKLAEWERRFYSVQQDALKHVPRALLELDTRLAKVLVQTAPKEVHMVASGVRADKPAAVQPVRQRLKDTPGRLLMRGESSGSGSGSLTKQSLPAHPGANTDVEEAATQVSLKESPAPETVHADGVNTKKQEALDANTVAIRQKAAKIVEKISGDIKSHPLRLAYESEVAGLKEEAEVMTKSGTNDETIAKKMWERRREIGVKYKNVTPEPLRDYIYEVNRQRYGDPLGPSFQNLVQTSERKLLDPYPTIIESSSRPNGDVNALLSKFQDWLATKDQDYVDEALKKLGTRYEK